MLSAKNHVLSSKFYTGTEISDKSNIVIKQINPTLHWTGSNFIYFGLK